MDLRQWFKTWKTYTSGWTILLMIPAGMIGHLFFQAQDRGDSQQMALWGASLVFIFLLGVLLSLSNSRPRR